MNSLEGVMVVGLTGQTGAGKTTVCKIFSENGFSIINADHVARQVMEKGQPCLKEICEFFGKDILLENGILDRPKLAGLVFTDKKKLELFLQEYGIKTNNKTNFGIKENGEPEFDVEELAWMNCIHLRKNERAIYLSLIHI